MPILAEGIVDVVGVHLPRNVEQVDRTGLPCSPGDPVPDRRGMAGARGFGGTQPRVVGLGVFCVVNFWAFHLARGFDRRKQIESRRKKKKKRKRG